MRVHHQSRKQTHAVLELPRLRWGTSRPVELAMKTIFQYKAAHSSIPAFPLQSGT